MATPTGRRREILALLRESPVPLTITDLAGRLGGHVNTARFHLEALVAAGQVERVPAEVSGPGRPPLAFRARRGMDPDGVQNYRLLADILVDALASAPDPVLAATQAGRTWGSHLDQPAGTEALTDDEAVGRLVGLLDDLGFAAEPRSKDGERQVGLRHCPFLDLVQEQGRVVCPMHLGLMQGAIGRLDTAVTVDRLDPFAEPDLCLVHLGTRAGSARPAR